MRRRISSSRATPRRATVKAPFTFHYQDHVGHQRRGPRPPPRSSRCSCSARTRQRAPDPRGPAFARARGELLALEQTVDGTEDAEIPPAVVDRVAEGFRDSLGVHVPTESVAALAAEGFTEETAAATSELVGRAMQQLVLRDRENLPHDGRGIQLITLRDGAQTPSVLTDLEELVTPAQARQQVNMALLERPGESESLDAAATLARGLVRANVSFAPLKTEEARRAAEANVALAVKTFKRGAILFRAGDTLTADHIQVYRELQGQRGDTDIAAQLLALTLLLLLLLTSLYYFGATYLQAFTTQVRDVAAVGTLLIATALIARMVVASSEGIATLIGYDAEPRSVWFMVPVAGARCSCAGCSASGGPGCSPSPLGRVRPDDGAAGPPGRVLLISAVAGASAVENARERISVLRAGASVGMVNAACVLFIHFVQLFVTENEVSTATAIRPVWSMLFAFSGGIGSAILVLGLTPVFEAVGFVTDIRLMELANLNHPLLRELMLRAPGSYHHSVIVGTLAEAGCERIGANGLRAKVASYFHDIGKSVKTPVLRRESARRHQSTRRVGPVYVGPDHHQPRDRRGADGARARASPADHRQHLHAPRHRGPRSTSTHKAREAGGQPRRRRASAAFRYPGPKPEQRARRGSSCWRTRSRPPPGR